jgi:hypothetical protein
MNALRFRKSTTPMLWWIRLLVTLLFITSLFLHSQPFLLVASGLMLVGGVWDCFAEKKSALRKSN